MLSPGAEYQLRCTIQNLRQNVITLREEIECLKERIRELESRLPRDPLDALQPAHRAIFEAVARVTSVGEEAAREVQELLVPLEGEPLDKALVTVLKESLKGHELGLQCSCGEAAAPLWQKNPAYVLGGEMSLGHISANGRRVKHGGYTKFPDLAGFPVVVRPDRRRSK